MAKTLMVGIPVIILMFMAGCDKEKIVTTTEYVHDVEYIESPPDTVTVTDTLTNLDSVLVYVTDTLVLHDTTVQVVSDTVILVNNVYDTVFVYDTIVSVEQHYDTVTITDTVLATQCSPNQHLAFAALQYYTDPLVIDLVQAQFGLTDGWIFYLSEFQSNVSAQSSTTYDIYGFIDYWTPDWSAFYPLDYYWRVTYTGDDPADPGDWQLTEPPSAAPSNTRSGLNLREDRAPVRTEQR